MSKLSSRERISRALGLKEVDRVPWIELGFHGKIVGELIGEEVALNTGFHPLDPDEYEKYLRQTIKLAKKIGLDALHLKCWAATLTFIETISPPGSRVYKRIGRLKDEKALKLLEGEFVKNSVERKTEILQCAEIFDRIMEKESLARGYDITAGFTDTWESMGMENFSISLSENPAFVKKVMSLFNNFYNGIISEIVSRFSVDFIWTCDDLAFKTGPFISLGHFREFIKPSFKKTREIIGDIPWILHSDGNILPIIEDLIEVGIKGFHPIEPQAMNIFDIKKIYGDRICLIGNLDVDLIERANKEIVEKEAKRLVENLGYKGYIFSSGNSITEWAKTENVLAIMGILKD